MLTIKLDQQLKRLEIKDFEIENEIVFNYFDKIPSGERSDQLVRALYIGVLALMEDRFSAFLSKTSNQLGTELESLKMIFDMKRELFFKSAIKGTAAESDIAEFLNEFFVSHKIDDKAALTGNVAGKLPKNKTGDIVCYINDNQDLKIVIECKFDKSIKLGDISSKDVFTRKTDTAWSQLIEAQANRDGRVAIIVMDVAIIDSTLLSIIQNVRFIPSVGFISIIDTQKGDYTNLAIAYMLARDIALNTRPVEMDKDTLAIIVNRMVKDIGDVLTIKSLVLSNIENCKNILSQLHKVFLLMEFNQQYLAKFLKDGRLTKEDLLNFYSGEDVRDKFKVIEKEIKSL